MSGDIPLTAVPGPSRDHAADLDGITEDTELPIKDNGKKYVRNVESKNKTSSLLRRLPSIRSSLRPTFGTFRQGLRKLSCIKSERDLEEETLAPAQQRLLAPRKSFDIGVGLARRMSLFIFTKRVSCVHPYHPYTPEQTTRKIYLFPEEK